MTEKQIMDLPHIESMIDGYEREIKYFATLIADFEQKNILLNAAEIKAGFKELESILTRSKNRLIGLRDEIYLFLDSITDPEIKTIFHLRHEKKLDWRKIGDTMGYDHTAVYRKYRQYLKRS